MKWENQEIFIPNDFLFGNIRLLPNFTGLIPE
jgi:hypothetical protein